MITKLCFIGLFGVWGTSCFALLPTDLMCNLYAKPGLMVNLAERPEFSWCFKQARAQDYQSGYQIQVATETHCLRADKPDLWDSGRIATDQSLFVPYAGVPLPAGRQICWRVRVWDRQGAVGPWSYIAAFEQGADINRSTVNMQAYPVVQTVVKPVKISSNQNNQVFVDFGCTRIGWLEIVPSFTEFRADTGAYLLHVGERATAQQRVNMQPPTPCRAVTLTGYLSSAAIFRYPFPSEAATVRGDVARTTEIGTLMPFRYVDVETSSCAITSEALRQVMIHYPCDDQASAFVCDEPVLDRIYAASKKTIKAFSYAGRYIEDDVQRRITIPATYIAQLGHLCTDREFTLPRNTLHAVVTHPGDTLQWRQLIISMAWNEWMYTGNTNGLAAWYNTLKTSFLLNAYARSEDGLAVTGTNLTAQSFHEQVDLHAEQSDGFQMGAIQSVANALYYRNLIQMQQIADVLGYPAEAATYAALAEKVFRAFHAAFYDLYLGRYVDHASSRHASLHANMYALACGVVPETEKQRIAHVLKTYGMACSPFAAQFMLEALFEANREEDAIQLMTTKGGRGWYAMSQEGRDLVQSDWNSDPARLGGTISVLGSVPANIIPRYLLGVRPLKPGFAKILIRPQIGRIAGVQGIVPTIRGPVTVGVRQSIQTYRLMFEIPVNTTARVELPPLSVEPGELIVDGKERLYTYAEGRLVFDDMPSGQHIIEWKKGR